MNPPSFMGSSTTEDPKNLVEELKKGFDVIHVVDDERFKLAAYQLKNVARTWFDQLRRAEMRMHHIRVRPILKRLFGAFLFFRIERG